MQTKRDRLDVNHCNRICSSTVPMHCRRFKSTWRSHWPIRDPLRKHSVEKWAYRTILSIGRRDQPVHSMLWGIQGSPMRFMVWALLLSVIPLDIRNDVKSALRQLLPRCGFDAASDFWNSWRSGLCPRMLATMLAVLRRPISKIVIISRRLSVWGHKLGVGMV